MLHSFLGLGFWVYLIDRGIPKIQILAGESRYPLLYDLLRGGMAFCI